MNGSNLLLVFLLLVKLSEELTIDSVEVQTMFALHEARKTIALEVAIELRLSYVTAVGLGNTLTDVLAPQDLISMRIVPSPLLIIRQARVSLLNLLELFRGVHVAIFIGVPLESSLLVRFLDYLCLRLAVDFQ